MLMTAGRRLLRGILVVLVVSFLVVALLDFAPGSIGAVILGTSGTPKTIAALNDQLGVNNPIWVQWGDWLGHAVRGNLGTSPISDESVLGSIQRAAPVTLELAILAELIALLVAVPLALVAASRPGTVVDRSVNGLSSFFLSVPAFVAAPLLLYFLAIKVHLFPVLGWVALSQDPAQNLRYALLPAIAIALPEIAAYQRLLRTDLAETLSEDYISAARAKGMTKRYVMLRHALRPSSFSLVTLAGIGLGRLIGGTVIVESLFSLPGLGQLMYNAILGKDIVTLQGCVAVIAVAYVVVNMLVDASYGLLDPRVRKAVAA